MLPSIFIVLTICFLFASSVTIWFAFIRGTSTVTAGQVAMDGMVLLLCFTLVGISSLAIGVNR